MRLQSTLSPGFKLLREGLVEATDGAGTGSNSHERLDHFPYLVGARSGHEHLGESFGNVWFIPTVAFKGLRMKLTLTISGNLQVLDPTRGSDEIAVIEAVAIAFPAAKISANKRLSTKTGKGNRWLRQALIEAANACASAWDIRKRWWLWLIAS